MMVHVSSTNSQLVCWWYMNGWKQHQPSRMKQPIRPCHELLVLMGSAISRLPDDCTATEAHGSAVCQNSPCQPAIRIDCC